MRKIFTALTYDDVLIVPKRSSFVSRSEASTKTRLTKSLTLNIPIVSANMDTVTESDMAIALARLGGIGIIHRFMTIEENAAEIRRVKRAQNFVIVDPYTVAPGKTVREAKQLAAERGVSGLLVVDDAGRLVGLVTRRDLVFAEDETLAREVMTSREKLIVGNVETSMEEAKKTMARFKVEKLPLVDENDLVVGLITAGDIEKLSEFPAANIDRRGQLLVGGAVGVHNDYLERAQELIRAGADVLVVDIAHGHSDLMFRAIQKLRDACGAVQLVAGNIATARAAQELCEAGVDAVKVGIGPGSTCITRLVAGCGVPQLSAVMNVAPVTHQYGVPLIADGGIQKSGDIVKAIGAGADTVMLGGFLAGAKESPGVVMNRGGKKYKVCRGSASFAVAQRRKEVHQELKNLSEVVPEGVESVVPYKGPVAEMVGQMVGGLRSGMSYTNSHTIAELQENAEFVRITPSGARESGPHDLEDVK